jgi:hypothetical protein
VLVGLVNGREMACEAQVKDTGSLIIPLSFEMRVELLPVDLERVDSFPVYHFRPSNDSV